MYNDITVEVPNVPGKITRQKNRQQVYISYETARVYNPVKKYNVAKKVVIGKEVKDNPKLMHPNENYEKYFGKVTPLSPQEPVRSSCLKAGAFIAFEKIANGYKLLKMLKQVFGDDAELMFDVSMYMLREETNVMQHYASSAYNNVLFTNDMRIYSDTSISRLLKRITKEKITKFLDLWNAEIDKNQKIYVYYDSTNKNTDAGDIELAEFGHAKDDKSKPVVNVSIAMDSQNRRPLLYEEYPGSINDVSQLKALIEKIREYGYRNLGFVLDRGYFARENIEYMDKHNYDFVIMAKGMKNFVRDKINSVRGKFENRRQFAIPHVDLEGITIEGSLFEGDKKTRYIHIYYNSSRYAAEKKAFISYINKQKIDLEKLQNKQTEIDPSYEKYFDIHYDKIEEKYKGERTFLFATEKTEVIDEEVSFFGYFCIITSEKMTAAEAYVLYKGRDSSEKLFCADKTFLGSSCMRVYTQEAASGKLFLEFIALIVRNRLYNLLRDAQILDGKRKKFLAVPAAIAEVNKIELVRRNQGQYHLDYAITRRQKTVFATLGMTPEEVEQRCASLCDRLNQLAKLDSQRQEEIEEAEKPVDVDASDCTDIPEMDDACTELLP